MGPTPNPVVSKPGPPAPEIPALDTWPSPPAAASTVAAPGPSFGRMSTTTSKHDETAVTPTVSQTPARAVSHLE